MMFLRIYLLAGLIAHKLLWEVLRRRVRTRRPNAAPLGALALLARAVKAAILLGIILQTASPVEIAPILPEAAGLRIFGIVVYSAGLVTAMAARIQLGRNWTDIEAGDVLSGHELVAGGIYRYIRHPIYAGDLLLLTGLQLALNSWLVAAAVLLAPPVVWQALREERLLTARLPGYAAYCRRTKRFIPFLV